MPAPADAASGASSFVVCYSNSGNALATMKAAESVGKDSTVYGGPGTALTFQDVLTLRPRPGSESLHPQRSAGISRDMSKSQRHVQKADVYSRNPQAQLSTMEVGAAPALEGWTRKQAVRGQLQPAPCRVPLARWRVKHGGSPLNPPCVSPSAVEMPLRPDVPLPRYPTDAVALWRPTARTRPAPRR